MKWSNGLIVLKIAVTVVSVWAAGPVQTWKEQIFKLCSVAVRLTVFPGLTSDLGQCHHVVSCDIVVRHSWVSDQASYGNVTLDPEREDMQFNDNKSFKNLFREIT